MLLYTLVIHWRFKTSTLKTQASLVAQLVKNLPAMQETLVQFLGQEDLLGSPSRKISSILGLPLWLSWYRIHPQCGRPGFDPWVGKIHCRRERLPPAAFWPGEFHGLCSPWGHKELDITEWTSLSPMLRFCLQRNLSTFTLPKSLHLITTLFLK